MSHRARLIASLTESPSEVDLVALSSQADCLEVRADLLPDVNLSWVRAHFTGELIYTLRSRKEGGECDLGPEERRRALIEASRDSSEIELLDLEGARDLSPELLAEIPADRRLISWHGPAIRQTELSSLLDGYLEHPARYYKLIPAADKPQDALIPLALLQSRRRDDVIAFASGPTGSWTRLIAPRLGAPVIFGGASALPAAPGQLSISRLRTDFGMPNLPEITDLFGIVGDPVAHSLSPILHNSAFRELGISALYLPFHVERFGDFWLDIVESGSLEVLGFNLRGLSVTAPHKRLAAAVAGAMSPRSERIGSANTLVRAGRVWEADTTDSAGILEPLLARGVSIKDRVVAVVGAGGAGRATAFALMTAGANVTLVNRGVQRGERVARELELPFKPLDDLVPGDFDLLVNATSLGRRQNDALPFDLNEVGPDCVIVDLVYLANAPTDLVAQARGRALLAIDGREVLLEQALPQFRAMTGRKMPRKLIESILGLDKE
jgi:3-dehydroquinate dehydratase/shikimate dehydrogenase